MTAVLATGLALLAFLLFGLATDQHHGRRFGRRLDRRTAQRRRMLAWIAIGMSLAAAIASRGWVFGPVMWVGLVMAGAATSFLLLNLKVGLRDRAT